MSALKNRLSTLPNEMILLIARTLRDANAARLKSVSSKLRRVPIYVPRHRTILNENNGYNNNWRSGFNNRWLPNHTHRYGLYKTRRDGKRVYLENHFELMAKKKAASMLSANRVPVQRKSARPNSRFTDMSYFGPGGYPYSRIRRIPAKRQYPFEVDSVPRVGRPYKKKLESLPFGHPFRKHKSQRSL